MTLGNRRICGVTRHDVDGLLCWFSVGDGFLISWSIEAFWSWWHVMASSSLMLWEPQNGNVLAKGWRKLQYKIHSIIRLCSNLPLHCWNVWKVHLLLSWRVISSLDIAYIFIWGSHCFITESFSRDCVCRLNQPSTQSSTHKPLRPWPFVYTIKRNSRHQNSKLHIII